MTLEPWGRNRGQLRVGTGVGARRLAGAEVWEPDYRGEPVVTFFTRALTDSEGRFAMDRVAPGHAMVYRPSWTADNKRMRSHRQGVDVGSGQTAEVMMGGAGRPVVGRLTRADGLPAFALEHVTGRLRFVQPSPEFPEGFADWDDAQKRKWWYAFYRTEEGRTYYEGSNTYAVKVEPDGSFRLDDVPEGRYWLELSYEKDPAEPFSDQEHTLVKVAVLEEYVEVPAGPDDEAAGPRHDDLDAARAGGGGSLTQACFHGGEASLFGSGRPARYAGLSRHRCRMSTAHRRREEGLAATLQEEGRMSEMVEGVIHGRTIELEIDPGLQDGERVEVMIRRVGRSKDSGRWDQGNRRRAGPSPAGILRGPRRDRPRSPAVAVS